MNKQKASIIGLVVIAVIVGGFWYAKNKNIALPKQNIEVPPNLYYDTTWTSTYITAETWPPVVTFEAGQFSCVESGDVVMPQGKTTQKSIDGKPYCVTVSSEGAAGSVYLTYTYKTLGGDGIVAQATFTIKEVQCVNYDDPEKTACQTERDLFDIDILAHKAIENSIE